MIMEKFWSKMSLVLAVVSTVLLLVGIATPEWLSRNGHYEGIWIYCYYLLHTDGETSCLALDKFADFEITGCWLQSVRVTMIISAAASFVSMVTHFIYIFLRNRRRGLKILLLTIVLCILSAILCMTGLIIYTTRVRIDNLKADYTIGWSFILCGVGGGVMLLLTLPLLIEIKQCRALALYELMT